MEKLKRFIRKLRRQRKIMKGLEKNDNVGSIESKRN